MARRKKNKPSAPRKVVMTPEEVAAKEAEEARAAAERKAERDEDRRVKAMPGGTVNRDERKGTVTRQVLDVVMLMARTRDDEGRPLIGAEETGAVRMLERMIEKANGGGGSCLSTLERVNGQNAGDPALAVIIRRTEASLQLADAARLLGPRTWAMLRELCDGALGLARWHSVVERHSGETGQKAQGAVVRMAFRELAAIMPEVARLAKERQKAANDTAPQHLDATG